MAVLSVLAAATIGCGRLQFEHTAERGGDAGADANVDDGSVAGARCGDGIVAGAELCDDGNAVDGDGCSADCSTRTVCGDGVTTPGEQCDDDNGTDGDGCDSDCTFSCVAGADCSDGVACNGDETCDGASHRCVAGPAMVDGTACGGGRACRAGSCAPASCGNGTTDLDEACDDGNTTGGDGCENDCTYTCTTDADCDDASSCDGRETCAGLGMPCAPGSPLPDGTMCERDGVLDTRDICLSGDCRRSVCGDAFVDHMAIPQEKCDDANAVNGDGCDNDCTFSCTDPSDCADANPCNGTETCSAMSHSCLPGSPLADGTPCGVGRRCTGAICLPPTPMDAGITDAGPPPTDGGGCPTTPVATMSLMCFKRCTTDADCVEVATNCCCSCSQGGGQDAVNAAYLSLWNGHLGCTSCTGILCADIYRCVPGEPACSSGQCVFGSTL